MKTLKRRDVSIANELPGDSLVKLLRSVAFLCLHIRSRSNRSVGLQSPHLHFSTETGHVIAEFLMHRNNRICEVEFVTSKEAPISHHELWLFTTRNSLVIIEMCLNTPFKGPLYLEEYELDALIRTIRCDTDMKLLDQILSHMEILCDTRIFPYVWELDIKDVKSFELPVLFSDESCVYVNL